MELWSENLITNLGPKIQDNVIKISIVHHHCYYLTKVFLELNFLLLSISYQTSFSYKEILAYATYPISKVVQGRNWERQWQPNEDLKVARTVLDL